MIIEQSISDYLQSLVETGALLDCTEKATSASPAMPSEPLPGYFTTSTNFCCKSENHAVEGPSSNSPRNVLSVSHLSTNQPSTIDSDNKRGLARVRKDSELPSSHEPPSHLLKSSPSLGGLVEGAREIPVGIRRPIFGALEDYIISCFEDIENLNASFVTRRPSPPTRGVSEGLARTNCVIPQAPTPSHVWSERMLPNLDAKTLLAGDIAENGFWWTGAEGKIEDASRFSPRTNSRYRSARNLPKYPYINWQELYEWYDCILSVQSKIEDVLKHKQSRALRSSHSWEPTHTMFSLASRREEIHSECSHLQKTLLKATERLLRRPRRQIRSPEQCRFLLLLLANPLLLPGSSDRSSAVKTGFGDAAATFRTISSSTSQKPLTYQSGSSQLKASGEYRLLSHTGIIKRICGLLSNLSAEYHRCLVNWLTRTPERFFRGCADITNLFLTYRLSRRNDSQQSDKTKNSNVLVPELSQHAMGSSAQVHAALGLGGAPKKTQNHEEALWYSSDWQIRSVARVISLLFAANIDHPARRLSAGSANISDAPVGKAPLYAYDSGQVNRQLLPTSHFYSSLLDFADLVTDYEVWESRKGLFTFCQYPMLLSIWAKIRLIEHDARRQMEIKAREAFFDSIVGRKAISQFLVFKIRRDCLVEDSLRNVSEAIGSGQDEIKKGLRIEFQGEAGFDAGGLRKEWFLTLIREVFDPDHGLFIYDDESHYCYFNSNTFETTDQFFLIGVVLGLAIYNSTILDIALPPFAFRKLLASAPIYSSLTSTVSKVPYSYSLEDLAELRPSLARGLRQLLDFEGDVQQTFCRDFVLEVDHHGQTVQIPLCENGDQIPVTNENRRKFVDLYVRYVLDTAVMRQYEPFKRGFFSVCGGNAITLFRPEEIDLLIRGSDGALDVGALRAVAVYENWGRGAEHDKIPVIRWFWSIFEEADPEAQRQILSFITSSDRIPAVGATSVVIKISCLGENCERFPIARTCFNMLGLYRYSTRARLREKLWRGVTESEGFGLR